MPDNLTRQQQLIFDTKFDPPMGGATYSMFVPTYSGSGGHETGLTITLDTRTDNYVIAAGSRVNGEFVSSSVIVPFATRAPANHREELINWMVAKISESISPDMEEG